VKINLDNITKEKIIYFIAGRRDREDIRGIADTILSSGDASSQAIIDIYIHHDLPIEEMSSLLHQGLFELDLLYIETSSKATLYLISHIAFEMVRKSIDYYDGFCEMRKIVKEYNELNKSDDYFGEAISTTLATLLHEFDLTEDIYASETPDGMMSEEWFNQKYEDSTVDETLLELCDESIFKDGTSFLSNEGGVYRRCDRVTR